MRLQLAIAATLLGRLSTQGTALNILKAYCGFGGLYCGEFYNDDVYARTNNVILAYALIAPNGAAIIDPDN